MAMVAYILDDRMTTSLDTAASDISSSSAFLRHPSFTVEGMAQVLNAAGHMAGRLLRWQISEQALRIVVCFDSSSDTVDHGYYYIEIGSVARISSTQHEAFLRAVEAAYPITDGSTFTCTPRAVPEAEPQTSQVPASSRTASLQMPVASRMDTDVVGAGGRHQKKKKKKKGKNKQQHEQQRRKNPCAKHISNHAKPRALRGEPSVSTSTSNSKHRMWARSVRVSR